MAEQPRDKDGKWANAGGAGGIAAWAGKGKGMSARAEAASATTKRNEGSADHSKKVLGHLEAARLHRDAAEYHGRAGNKSAANYHNEMAGEHGQQRERLDS